MSNGGPTPNGWNLFAVSKHGVRMWVRGADEFQVFGALDVPLEKVEWFHEWIKAYYGYNEFPPEGPDEGLSDEKLTDLLMGDFEILQMV